MVVQTPKGPSSGNGSEEARRRGEIAFEISQALVEELPRLVDQITTRVTAAISERERVRTSVRYPRCVTCEYRWCLRCERRGHTQLDCPFPTPPLRRAGYAPYDTTERCRHCGQFGHGRIDCPMLRGGLHEGQGQSHGARGTSRGDGGDTGASQGTRSIS